MPVVLITGGQGFIGSYVCTELLNNGYEVISVDNFSKYGKVNRPHDKHPNFTLIEDDVQNMPNIGILNKIDLECIIAGAAMIGGIHYFHKYAYDLLATNERILASTFDLAIRCFKEDRLRKILVLSSSMVFENTEVYPTPESEVVTCSPPSSTYGFQKLASEYFCKGAHEQYGLPYTIIRPFNCIGIGEDEALSEEEVVQGNIKMMMSHVVPDLIYKSLVVGPEGTLPILGHGNQVRHYTHGEDIARGVRIAMESQRAINDDFNISSDRPTTVLELAEIIWQTVHGDVPLKISHEEPLLYDVQIRSPDTRKAARVLDFQCERKLEDVLPEIVDWVRKQQQDFIRV